MFLGILKNVTLEDLKTKWCRDYKIDNIMTILS